MKYALIFVITIVVFAAIDFTWITKIGANFYQSTIGHLFAPKPSIPPAVVFYLLYMGAMFYFAILPGIKAGSISTALLNGAALGFISYATYDLTNMATLPGWPLKITLIDMAWGTFITASMSAFAVYLARIFAVVV